jgi:hypothetical protein
MFAGVMVTMDAPIPNDRVVGAPTAASALLRGLVHEQHDFLDRMVQSPALLPEHSRNLGEMLAFQARLTRQFFDAQRMLLERSARLDDEIASIDQAGAAAAIGGTSLGPVVDIDLDSLDDGSARHTLAALSAAVVRTRDDVESLSKVLAEAFAPGELPFGAALDDVTAALERCWRDAERVAEMRLADARARAAMLVHFARVEAGHSDDHSTTLPVIDEPSTPVATAVPAVNVATDLEALLAQFDDSLDGLAEPTWADDEVVVDRAAVSADQALINLGGPTRAAGDGFWDAPARRREAAHRRLISHSPAAGLVLAIAALLRLK